MPKFHSCATFPWKPWIWPNGFLPGKTVVVWGREPRLWHNRGRHVLRMGPILGGMGCTLSPCTKNFLRYFLTFFDALGCVALHQKPFFALDQRPSSFSIWTESHFVFAFNRGLSTCNVWTISHLVFVSFSIFSWAWIFNVWEKKIKRIILEIVSDYVQECDICHTSKVSKAFWKQRKKRSLLSLC